MGISMLYAKREPIVFQLQFDGSTIKRTYTRGEPPNYLVVGKQNQKYKIELITSHLEGVKVNQFIRFYHCLTNPKLLAKFPADEIQAMRDWASDADEARALAKPLIERKIRKLISEGYFDKYQGIGFNETEFLALKRAWHVEKNLTHRWHDIHVIRVADNVVIPHLPVPDNYEKLRKAPNPELVKKKKLERIERLKERIAALQAQVAELDREA